MYPCCVRCMFVVSGDSEEAATGKENEVVEEEGDTRDKDEGVGGAEAAGRTPGKAGVFVLRVLIGAWSFQLGCHKSSSE